MGPVSRAIKCDGSRERPALNFRGVCVEKGDVVYLKSGGPAMTIRSVSDVSGAVSCVWHGSRGLDQAIFPVACVTSKLERHTEYLPQEPKV